MAAPEVGRVCSWGWSWTLLWFPAVAPIVARARSWLLVIFLWLLVVVAVVAGCSWVGAPSHFGQLREEEPYGER